MSSGRREIDRWFSAEVQDCGLSEVRDHILFRLSRSRYKLARAEARSASLELRREVADSCQSTGHLVQHLIRWCSRMLEIQDEIIADIKLEIALLSAVSAAFEDAINQS